MEKLLGYIHEIWLCPDASGELLPACIPFGPAGEAARALIEPGSVCVWLFWTNSHVETMSIYHEFMNLGPYSTSHALDYQRYPESWLDEQRAYIAEL